MKLVIPLSLRLVMSKFVFFFLPFANVVSSDAQFLALGQFNAPILFTLNMKKEGHDEALGAAEREQGTQRRGWCSLIAAGANANLLLLRSIVLRGGNCEPAAILREGGGGGGSGSDSGSVNFSRSRYAHYYSNNYDSFGHSNSAPMIFGFDRSLISLLHTTLSDSIGKAYFVKKKELNLLFLNIFVTFSPG